jgi:hypothetical protein
MYGSMSQAKEVWQLAITPAHASQYVGRPVCAHCYGRKHYGILQQVTQDGIYLQQMGGGAVVDGDKAKADFSTADRPEGANAENVFFGRLFLPFLALSALTPWWGFGGWGGFGWGGYGGYWW